MGVQVLGLGTTRRSRGGHDSRQDEHFRGVAKSSLKLPAGLARECSVAPAVQVHPSCARAGCR